MKIVILSLILALTAGTFGAQSAAALGPTPDPVARADGGCIDPHLPRGPRPRLPRPTSPSDRFALVDMQQVATDEAALRPAGPRVPDCPCCYCHCSPHPHPKWKPCPRLLFSDDVGSQRRPDLLPPLAGSRGGRLWRGGVVRAF